MDKTNKRDTLIPIRVNANNIVTAILLFLFILTGLVSLRQRRDIQDFKILVSSQRNSIRSLENSVSEFGDIKT